MYCYYGPKCRMLTSDSVRRQGERARRNNGEEVYSAQQDKNEATVNVYEELPRASLLIALCWPFYSQIARKLRS